MKNNLLTKFIFCIIFLSQTILPVYASDKNPYYIPSMDLEAGKKIWNQFMQQQGKTSSQEFFSDETSDNLVAWYKADINNDNKIEYVFDFAGGGTGRWDTVIALQQQGEKLIYVGEPPKPIDSGDGPWYTYPYSDKKSHQDQFLTQLSGQTYMVFNYGGGEPFHDAFLWKNNSTVIACDSNWVKYEHGLFQKFYNNKLYSDAYAQLNFIVNRCKKDIDPQLYLWFLNDLAIAALKNGNAEQCKHFLAEINDNPVFSQASEKFKKAVIFNKTLCAN